MRRLRVIISSHLLYGEVAEWSMAHAWKACVGQLTAGSNPALSAMQWSYRSNPFAYGDGTTYRASARIQNDSFIGVVLLLANSFLVWINAVSSKILRQRRHKLECELMSINHLIKVKHLAIHGFIRRIIHPCDFFAVIAVKGE